MALFLQNINQRNKLMFNTKKILELEYQNKLLKSEYSSLMDTHNELVEKHNNLVADFNEAQETLANLPEYQLGFLKHQER